MLTLAKKSTDYELHMAGVTQNKKKFLFSLWFLEVGKFHYIRSKGRVFNIRKKNCNGIDISKNNDNKIVIPTIMIIVILVTK